MPIIFETSSNWGSEDASYSPMNSPFRNTVILSLISYTWSRKWVTKTMPTPRDLRSRMRENSFRTSSSSRDEVGSSRTRILQSMSTARAMAIICWTASEQPESGWVAPAGMPSDSRSAVARAFIRFQSTRKRRLRPMNMFSATLRLGQSEISW